MRYSFTTHPLTPTSGTSFGAVAAEQDTEQQMSAPINWANRAYVYFSIFGVRPDSTYTPPELAAVKVDVVPPATPLVTATTDGNGTVSAQWVCATSQTQIAQYQYAVGSQPGGCDLKEWVVTIYTSASIPALPVGASGYVSVVAINHFGFRSTYCSSKFAIIPATEKIAQALAKPENQVVTVCGVVSAVFGDCCYIEAADSTREIKLMGNIAGYKLGYQITVTGALGITNG